MTTRRIFALLLALVLAFALCACGGKNTNTPANDASMTLEGVPAIPDFTKVNTSAFKGVEDGVLTVGMECA